MSTLAQYRHGYTILRQVVRHRLDRLVPAEQIPHAGVRFGLKLLDRLLPDNEHSRGERLKQALLDLGPVFIKLGQLLSTRRDLFPPDIIDPLTTLQDRVPPIADLSIKAFVSEHLGSAWQETFSHIDESPLASASIAQVHAATLITGESVVIKIVRPGIRAVIAEDMALLNYIAQWLDAHVPAAERLHLPAVARDHEQVLMAELDMFSESRNQIQLRRNFAESDLLYVPRVYAHLTRDNLFVMERISGTPVGDVAALRDAGVDFKVLADKGVETFFTQVFEDNFFHADMHPGNILIDTSDPSNPRYIALDCAIIGSLTEADQNYLAQNLVAFFSRDYRRVVDLHLESGWVPPDTDAEAFEEVIKAVCDPIFAKPLAEISFADFIIELFQTAGQFNMEVQPQLVLLQKTLLYIEGVGRQLYPQLDLWETAQPFMERWTTEHLGPAAVLNDWLSQGPKIWAQLARLPATLTSGERDLALLKQHVRQQSQSITRIESRLAKQANQRRHKQIGGAALLAIATVLLWQPLVQGLNGGDLSTLAGVVSALAGSTLLLRG